MTNSRNPAEVFDRKTSKNDRDDHGFGLSILEDIAARYDGSCQWQNDGGCFHSVVMLRY